MTTTINLRRHYHLYLTNTKDNSHGAGPYALLFPDEPTFRGTPRQVLAEIQEFRRRSGQSAVVGVRVVDPKTGERVNPDDLRFEVSRSSDR